MCEDAIASLLRAETWPDGRIRHWGRVNLPGEQKPRILRVITLEDGATVHNAFLDRGFDEDRP